MAQWQRHGEIFLIKGRFKRAAARLYYSENKNQFEETMKTA